MTFDLEVANGFSDSPGCLIGHMEKFVLVAMVDTVILAFLTIDI